ncbi:hypothetical protein CHS0354_004935 [Potamilus streckersoni]|uniref:Uncharacterized protein n=1 Tax=Potamilus streckersoni TaxID=2493646 RepID=A0AAE0TJ36_9BIVA|nr:hypothetical protein CHS0354_004935 [Potamilus streckersoni]
MATAKEQSEAEPTCPICLGHFNVPRQLPCAHTYCQSCLQSYITSEAIKHEQLEYIQCPLCRQRASPFKRNEATTKWASLFPIDTVLHSILPTKSKVDRVCDACNSEGVSVTAEGFCVVCQEAMCGDCLKFHRKQKVSKNHTIITLDELSSNPQNIMKIAEGFTCSEHYSEDVQFYCKDHNAACCGTCSYRKHKTCFNVIDFKTELPSRLQETKAENIVDELKKVESHIQRYTELNELNINNLQSQVNGLSAKIQEIRRNINIALDKLEVRIKTEGSQMYKEIVIRKQEENHDCLSLMHAIRNSRILLETVNMYGSDPQKFLMTEKITLQLSSYYTQVREKCMNNETISIELEYSPLIESVLSLSSSGLGKLVTKTTSENLTIPGLLKATKDCQFEKVDVIDVKLHGNTDPLYYGVTFLHGNRVMLADWNQSRCIMLSSSYEFITSYTLTGRPASLCVVDDQEVAVSIPSHNTIQILSVRDDIISPIRTIITQQTCYGIEAAGKGEIVVTGYCGNNKYYWSLISMEGDVKSSQQFDSPSGYFNYIAINRAKTRVYVTLPGMNTLLCFDMEGKKQFTYNPSNLRYPYGVLVDRDDNIFVTGSKSESSNIHHLSPDGSVIQVITTGVPKRPFAICMDKRRDMFIVTGLDDKRKIHMYRLK